MASITPTQLACSKETNTSKGAYLRLNITNITQTDGATNQTTIKWSITVHGTPYVYLYGVEAKLGGKSLYSYKKTTPLLESWSAGQTVKSGTVTFDNNSDGTLELEASLQQLFYYGYNSTRWNDRSISQKATTTMVCSQIPRANAPSCDNVTLGNAVTINTNRASDAFTHTIKIKNSGGTVIETFTGVGASKSWTPAIATYAPYITTSKTGTFTIESTTYSGDTEIGTKISTVVLTVPNTVKPTAAITISETNNKMLQLNWGIYVKGKSQLAVQVTGTKAYGSAIKSYSSTVEGVTKSGSLVSSNTLTIAGSNSVKATVTDARGYTSNEASLSYTVVDYAKPAISTKTVSRCNSDGTDNDEGTYLKYSFVGSISPVNNKNAKSFKIGYKARGTSTYTYVTVESSAYSVNKSNVVLSGVTFSTDTTYDIVFQATDSFETIGVEDEIGTGFDIINVNKSGKAIAIGKLSEAGTSEKLFEVGMPAKLDTLLSNTGRISSADLEHQYPSNKASIKFNIATSSMTTNKPGDGYLFTLFWDNSGEYDSQIFLPDTENTRLKFRSKGGATSWPTTWKDIAWSSDVPTKTSQLTNDSNFVKKSDIYPVGSIYLSVNSTSPASLFGGTWERLQDRFLLGAGDTYANGATGGEATHLLTGPESGIQRHDHSLTYAPTSSGEASDYKYGIASGSATSSYSGKGWVTNLGTLNRGPIDAEEAHNNMPPYLVVYMWKRTA